MKTFDYLRPRTVEEACELKTRHGAAAQFIAGGTDLLMEARRGTVSMDVCIDLTFIPELRYFTWDECVRLGALTTLATLAKAEPGPDYPLAGCVSATASQMATPQLRTTATVGGNLCHASPCADMAVVMTALGAEGVLRSTNGTRTLAMEEFFKGVNQTGLAEDEMLTELRIPVPAGRSAARYLRAKRTSVDLAQASAAVFLTTCDDATISGARIAIGACAPVPVSSKSAADILLGLDLVDPDRGAIELAAGRAEWETSPICDIRGSDQYRREVSKVLVRRAIEGCMTDLATVPATL
jgi:aerobic carbon-monoxide dehydrogenase medium subunit